MRIVFFGTPDFAVETLSTIYDAGYNIVGVVTAPDKPAGRGQKLLFSDVKKFALAHQLPIFQPTKFKDKDFLKQLKNLNASVFVVVAFRMLPEEVFMIPPAGTFNVHASLLPNYRGAAPIHHAIMNGETETGVTTFFLNNKIDKGDIITQRKVIIGKEETTGELYDRLKVEGAKIAIDTLKMIEEKRVSTIAQTTLKMENLKLAPKITKEDLLIDWNNPAEKIYNQIRGLSPSPAAYTRVQNNNGEIFIIKCYSAKILTKRSTEEPGSITIVNNKECSIATQNFQISLLNIQFQNKKRMKIEDFLAGFRKENYTLFLF